jgi:DNA repair exonuclease SbcCD nuclease subunit
MSIPFGIISDCHNHSWSQFSHIYSTGINSRLQDILDAELEAGRAVLAAGGKRLYIAGDLFHVRGSVSPKVLNPTKDLFEKLTGLGLEIRILTGNHDLESRDSESLSNACEALSPIEGVKVISHMTIFHDDNVVMVPWYDSLDDVRSYIKAAIEEIEDLGDTASSYTLMIHAPMNGVLTGIPDHGFYYKELEGFGFKRVFSGHYHNHRKMGESEVYSCGALTHQTWNDIGTRAGHMIVTDTDVIHTKSKAPEFREYDIAWDDDTAAEQCKGNFIRVRLGEADEDEITMIRDHITGLGALGCLVQAVAVPKGTATARTASAAAKAPTLGESVSEWIKNNAAASTSAEVDKLCGEILTEVRSVTV